MTDLSLKGVTIALFAGAFSFAALPAMAVPARYDFTATFDFDPADDPTESVSGTAAGFVEYELGITGSDLGGATSFPLTAFSITYTGGPTDGRMFSSAAGGSGFMNQSGQSANFALYAAVFSPEIFSFRFESLYTSIETSALIDTSAFVEGFGYGTEFERPLTNLAVSASLVPPSVPLPSSGALLALAAGGVAMRSAAKRRRAAKRAAQTS